MHTSISFCKATQKQAQKSLQESGLKFSVSSHYATQRQNLFPSWQRVYKLEKSISILKVPVKESKQKAIYITLTSSFR